MDLGKTQFFSITTKAITTALGIIQSILIIRLLSRGEYGLAGLVMSIGGLIGVSQNLGIVDGAIREIAILKDKREVGKVFWVSHLARQVVTIPLSILLIIFSQYIALRYHKPEIAQYIPLYAAVLILQGLQDVLAATLTGTKRFVQLYSAQIVTAVINIFAFGYLTWVGHVYGFFWAIIITTSIMVVILAWFVWRELRGYLALPSMADIREYGRRVMKIGAYMYVSRILFVAWQQLPLLFLGGVLTNGQLGDLNISLTFGSRLTILAAALSEVNMSWMSSLFSQAKHEFKQVVQDNMQRLFVLMTGMTLVLIFLAPEIIHYVIGKQYGAAGPLILVMTLAYFLYALTDIGTSSLFVPADETRIRMFIYIIMMAVSGGLMTLVLYTHPTSFNASVAVLLGSAVAYTCMIAFARRRFQISFLTPQLAVFLTGLCVATVWLLRQPALTWRVGILIILMAYISYLAHKHQLLPRQVRGLFDRFAVRPPAGEEPVICFAGAAFNQTAWTNRQHMMARISQQRPVLYVEPRVWIVRLITRHWRKPRVLLSFARRLFWYEKKHAGLYIKAQCNLIPGSREFKLIAYFNHYLNRLSVLGIAHLLHFNPAHVLVWIYDTEAAEYLSAFPKATVLYDCVDDHGTQAGVDRNPQRVQEEEKYLMQRADIVTVTSKRLFELKRQQHPNVHLVLNAGDVTRFTSVVDVPVADRPGLKLLASLPRPVLGTVGALDSYKVDFPLIESAATRHPEWQFVFAGAPMIDGKHHSREIDAVTTLANVHRIGLIPHEEVPAYVNHFDLCLIPYRANEYNKASFPLKFWEFMATGKPVIVTGVPELKEYSSLIGYAESVAQLEQLITYWLTHPEEKRAERIALAREHSWEKRVETILDLIQSYEHRV